MVKVLKTIENKTAFVTVKHLSSRELNKLELDVPSLEKQNSIASSLLKLETVIRLREKEFESLDDGVKQCFVFVICAFQFCTFANQKLDNIVSVFRCLI